MQNNHVESIISAHCILPELILTIFYQPWDRISSFNTAQISGRSDEVLMESPRFGLEVSKSLIHN
jgi:hypothetical protein